MSLKYQQKEKDSFVVRHKECLLVFGRMYYISIVIFLLEMDHFNSKVLFCFLIYIRYKLLAQQKQQIPNLLAGRIF